MDPLIITIIVALVCLVAGILLGKIVFAKNTQKQLQDAESQAQSIVREAELRAETIKKEKQLEAKEKFVQLKAEHDKEVLEKNKKINEAENRIKQKEVSINQKDTALEKQVKENEAIKENLNRQIEVVHDQGQPVNGYALYLRYENERGDALAQWLCEHPDHRWLTQLGTLLATSYHIPLHDYTPHTLAA